MLVYTLIELHEIYSCIKVKCFLCTMSWADFIIRPTFLAVFYDRAPSTNSYKRIYHQ